VRLPHQLSGAAVKASAARNARVRSTTDGFTRPELARAAAAAAAAGEVPDAGGDLEGLDDVVALPGFQMPPEQWPNRLADPEGKLRPPEHRSDGVLRLLCSSHVVRSRKGRMSRLHIALHTCTTASTSHASNKRICDAAHDMHKQHSLLHHAAFSVVSTVRT
jgi:hypothetical protein